MPFSGRRSTRSASILDADDKTTTNVSFHSTNDISGEAGSDIQCFELADPKPELSSGASTLTAHQISYHVNLPTPFWQKEKKLTVLTNITAVFAPGLNAILGNFGAGKTSFLNVLAGRVDKDVVDGRVLLNGHSIPENFRYLAGFVSQQDTLQGSLTVRENISFSASLRLPSCLTNSERNERINSVIRELGLCNCEDVKVGTHYIKGVTPGTRKLCSIGVELVVSPPVLFLDEPTTFLDPITANLVICKLQKLSSYGRTVIFSVTQPRHSAFERFDSILLLSSGCTIFHGPPKDALNFFETQGYKCPAQNNPADFFMEVINADASSIGKYRRYAKLQNNERVKNSTEDDTDTTNEFYDRVLIEYELVKGFASSQWCADLLLKTSDVYARYERRQRLSVISMNMSRNYSTLSTILKPGHYSTSVLNQLLLVSVRAVRNFVRNPEKGLKTALTALFFSTLMAGIYWQLEKEPATGFSDRAGVLFFMLLIQLFYNTSSLEKYFRERVTFLHENKNGFYRVSVYVFVKIIVDILSTRVVFVGLLSLVSYFAVGLRNNAESFFLFVLCLFLVTMTSAGVSLLVAASFQTFGMGQIALSMVYMLMLLFSGYMINLSSLGLWISWMQYLSMIKYSLTALYINEFKDRVFCAGRDNNTTCQAGNVYLSQNDMNFGSRWDFWHNYLALFLLCLVLFVSSYVQMRRLAAFY